MAGKLDVLLLLQPLPMHWVSIQTEEPSVGIMLVLWLASMVSEMPPSKFVVG